MNRPLSIGLKDVRITARDRSALLILLAMPAVLILILNMAFGNMSGNSDPVPTMIVNNDRGEIGQRIVDGFTKSADIKTLTTVKVTKDETAARKSVARGDKQYAERSTQQRRTTNRHRFPSASARQLRMIFTLSI